MDLKRYRQRFSTIKLDLFIVFEKLGFNKYFFIKSNAEESVPFIKGGIAFTKNSIARSEHEVAPLYIIRN